VRIAIVSTPFIRVPPVGYGGTELFCYELAEQLHDRGHDVTLFTTGDSVSRCARRALYAQPQWPPTAADEVNHVSWAFSEIERERFDVAHLNSPLGVPLSRFMSVPVVYTIHHRREESFSRIFGAHPDLFYVAISRRQAEIEVPVVHGAVIHHGVSARRYPPSVEDRGYLLHLGRYAPEKGTHLAIEAARAAGVPIVLAGRAHPQDAEYFRDQVAPLLGGPGVDQVGEADHDAKVNLMRGARALLLPLQWEEPFGLVAIEAMLCGTPVIGFPRGSFPEIVDEGVTGKLVPNDDVAAMARAVGELRGFDRAACARRARERFSTEVMTDRYESVYRQAVSLGFKKRRRAA
jgi:glycosyltransferase involved in cell wall biosynthesis